MNHPINEHRLKGRKISDLADYTSELFIVSLYSWRHIEETYDLRTHEIQNTLRLCSYIVTAVRRPVLMIALQ